MKSTRLLALVVMAFALITPALPAHAALQPVGPSLTPANVQVIDVGGVHLVLESAPADLAQPTIRLTFGWVTGTVYFNIPETLSVANGWGGAGAFTAACGVLGSALAGPYGAVVGAALCGAESFAIIYQASVGANSVPRRCLKIKMPITLMWAQPGTYTGGYCTW